MHDDGHRMPAEVEDVLRRAVAGDRAAQEQYFESVRPVLKRTHHVNIPGRLRAGYDTSDLVQDTLIKAARQLGGLRGATRTEAEAWLLAIAEHELADLSRQRSLETVQEKRDVDRLE